MQQLDGRRGAVFSVRVTQEQREELEALRDRTDGPRSLGPFLVWRALAGSTRSSGSSGSTRAARHGRGTTPPGARGEVLPPPSSRLILDLCAGTGAWSEPYKRAGYRVTRVTWPHKDVRTFVLPRRRVWGVLCAPPCTEFSLAKNGSARDFAAAMACVNACLRLVLQARPRWWALENPVGLLSTWLGTPRDVFEPCDFGDPWTKRTALWGDFALAERGPFVKPIAGKLTLARTADERARTPAGFARAFFEANP